ncbi:MAG: PEP-CTERM sorting domain-containing protein [Phycisphaeraceae bacterium]
MKNARLLLMMLLVSGLGAVRSVEASFIDDPTPGVRFVEPLNGSTVQETFEIEVIFTEGFAFEPEYAVNAGTNYADGTRRANAGHYHIYATRIEPGVFHSTVGFTGAVDTLTQSITLEAGHEYLLLATMQYDDHTLRVMNHPQNFPSVDAVTVNVIPEPASLALLGLGGTLLLCRRRRRAGTHD